MSKNLGFLIISFLFLSPFFLTLNLFDRPYDVPQAIFFSLSILILWLRLSSRDFRVFDWALASSFAIFSLFIPTLPFSVSLVLIAICSYFLISELSDDDRTFLRSGILLCSIAQAVLAICSFVNVSFPGLEQLNGAPIGTIGNPDFLATLIAAGVFILLDRFRKRSVSKFAALLLLIAGLLATKSRGTIGLTTVLILWRYLPRHLLTIGGIFAFLIFGVFWQKFSGRIQLWWVSWSAFLDRPWTGYGLGNADSAYFNKNLEIMTANSEFRRFFGPWSSYVTDAHNLGLHWALEFGIAGFLAALLVWWFFSGQLSKVRCNSDRKLLALILFKSLYTVVLISVQNIVLFAFAFSERKTALTKNCRSVRILMVPILILSFAGIVSFSRNSADIKIAMGFLRIGLPEHAIQSLDRILEREPENNDALLAKSFALYRDGRCSESSYYSLRAVAVRQNIDVFKRAGHILFECRFYEEASNIFEKLHIVFPEHRTTTMKLAWTNYYLGNFGEAKILAKDVIYSSPRRKSFSDEKNLREAADLLQRLHD